MCTHCEQIPLAAVHLRESAQQQSITALMKTCPNCQLTYPDDFSLCPRDGAHLAAPATETEAQLAAGLSRRFRLVRCLGKGGMGTVFLAEQTGVGNRPVALKVLNKKLLDDPDFLQRFQNEAGSTGRIHHPNVVTIHESAQGDDGTPYIAMEYLDGESLREVLQRRGALPVPEVADILQQAAKGLNAAHKLGIVHRDIKPDNIFLTRGEEGERVVKVVDFGIAKLRESASHTMTGMVLGTPVYMSCEQASGMRSDELDARSDVYSLGVVVYEMLTGRVPFHSDTPVGYLRKHMLEEPPPFSAVAQGLGVPPAIERVVMKALVKDRSQRYSSALDFARELANAAQAPSRAEAQEPLPSTIVVSPPRERPSVVTPLVEAAPKATSTSRWAGGWRFWAGLVPIVLAPFVLGPLYDLTPFAQRMPFPALFAALVAVIGGLGWCVVTRRHWAFRLTGLLFLGFFALLVGIRVYNICKYIPPWGFHGAESTQLRSIDELKKLDLPPLDVSPPTPGVNNGMPVLQITIQNISSDVRVTDWKADIIDFDAAGKVLSDTSPVNREPLSLGPGMSEPLEISGGDAGNVKSAKVVLKEVDYEMTTPGGTRGSWINAHFREDLQRAKQP
jgi:predicted Ser/Thr protein kinase